MHDDPLSVNDLDRKEINRMLKRIDRAVDRRIPDGAGFLVIITDENGDYNCSTATNLCKHCVSDMLREFADKLDRETAELN